MNIDWTYDEVVLATALVVGNGFGGLRAHKPEVQELSALLRTATIHPTDGRPDNFRSPSSVQRKTFDIATQHPEYRGVPTRGGPHDALVLKQFISEPGRMTVLADEIRGLIGRDAPAAVGYDPELEELSAWEGMLVAGQHLRRERDPKLRRAKLEKIKSESLPLACEVCGFDFEIEYGPLGAGYIEVHHVLPLHASGPRRTRIEDLALLCANCHRMIHRANPWLIPAQLRGRLSSVALK